MSFYRCWQCGATKAHVIGDGGERFCSMSCEAAWAKAGGQYGEGYRAAIAAVKGEIEAERLHRSSQGYRSPLVVDDILARIARLEKEHGG